MGGLECKRAHPDGEQAGHPHGGGAGCDRTKNEKLCPQGGAVAAGGRFSGAGTRTAPGQPHPVPVAPHRRLLESGRRIKDQPEAAEKRRHRGACTFPRPQTHIRHDGDLQRRGREDPVQHAGPL